MVAQPHGTLLMVVEIRPLVEKPEAPSKETPALSMPINDCDAADRMDSTRIFAIQVPKSISGCPIETCINEENFTHVRRSCGCMASTLGWSVSA